MSDFINITHHHYFSSGGKRHELVALWMQREGATEIEDLEKAKWCIEDRIRQLQKDGLRKEEVTPTDAR